VPAYARRARNQNDRRSVRVEMTNRVIKELQALYGPLAKDGGLHLQKYTEAGLAALLKYLEDGRRLQPRTQDEFGRWVKGSSRLRGRCPRRVCDTSPTATLEGRRNLDS
jgi:hypothetical protein